MYRIRKMDDASIELALGSGLRVWGAAMAVLGIPLALLGIAAFAGTGSAASLGLGGFGAVFSCAGFVMLQARRAHPRRLVFDNAAQHFIMRGRGKSEARIGYGEILGIRERYVRERGHIVFLHTRGGAIFDLWSTGWTTSKKGEALARRLNETVKFKGSSEVDDRRELPGWITTRESGGTRYYAWKDRGAVSRLLLGLGIFCGLVITSAGFMSGEALSATAAYMVLALAGAAAAGAAALAVPMLTRVNVLAAGPSGVRYGRSRSIDTAIRGFKVKKSMERGNLVGVRYSFDTAQGLGEFIVFLDREAYDLLEDLRDGRVQFSKIGKTLGAYFRIFRVHIPGRDASDLLNFARYLGKQLDIT